MTPEKQDKTLELSKHWSVDSTPARNKVIMKRTYPVKSIKCNKIIAMETLLPWQQGHVFVTSLFEGI